MLQTFPCTCLHNVNMHSQLHLLHIVMPLYVLAYPRLTLGLVHRSKASVLCTATLCEHVLYRIPLLVFQMFPFDSVQLSYVQYILRNPKENSVTTQKHSWVKCFTLHGYKVAVKYKFSGTYPLMSKFESFYFLSPMWSYVALGHIIYACNDFMCILQFTDFITE